MNILVTLDSNYVGPLTVMLKSLVITNPTKSIDLWVAHSSLTEEDFSKINDSLKIKPCNPARVHSIKVDPGILEKAPVLKRISKETYYRLLMMDYLPKNIDRVLYIDPDTVILRDISSFYNIDFKGKTLAAAGHTKSFVEGLNRIRFKNPRGVRYFNAGIMMVNLKKLRRVLTKEMVFDYVEKNKRWLFLADQDVLNGLLGKDTLFVDECLYNLDEKTVLFNKRKIKNLKWVEDNAVIVHFNGKYKPWKEGYKGILAPLYFKIRDYEVPFLKKVG